MTSTTNSPSPLNEKAILVPTDSRGRVKLPKERREALLEEFERSGMSGAEFAKWAGVKYPTFASWMQKRRKELGNNPEKPSVAVNLVEAVLPEEMAGGGRKGVITIHLPGEMRVDCGSASEAAEFVRLLGVGTC